MSKSRQSQPTTDDSNGDSASPNRPRRTRRARGRVGSAAATGGMNAELFESLRLSDVNVNGLDEQGRKNVAHSLRKLLSRDFVLGNASDAEINEVRWLARNTVDMLRASFPPDESVVQGSYRKVLLGDEHDGRESLSNVDERQLEQFVFAFLMRITRSEDGYQMDKIADSHEHSVLERRDDSGGRTLFGRDG